MITFFSHSRSIVTEREEFARKIAKTADTCKKDSKDAKSIDGWEWLDRLSLRKYIAVSPEMQAFEIGPKHFVEETLILPFHERSITTHPTRTVPSQQHPQFLDGSAFGSNASGSKR